MRFKERNTTRREFVSKIAAGTGAVAVAGSLSSWAVTTNEKYKSFFHKLSFVKGQGGPGCADSMFRMTGNELNGRETNLTFGYFSKPGAYGNKAIVHPYDTCLAFVGLDHENPDYLGAEIEISLGKNFEKYAFSVPTIVCIPRNMPFGPIVAKKVERPYAHYEIGLSREYRSVTVPIPVKASGGREFAHLIKKISDTAMGDVTKVTGPGNAFWISWPRANSLEDFNVNFTWGFYRGLGNWHAEGFDPHVHLGDEFLVFVGLNPEKPGYLGSEIDLYMGKELELHTFNTPMIAVCPEMFVHAPIITKKVDDIYAFFLIRRDKGEFTREKTPDGYPIQ